jgi:hypothetical protein
VIHDALNDPDTATGLSCVQVIELEKEMARVNCGLQANKRPLLPISRLTRALASAISVQSWRLGWLRMAWKRCVARCATALPRSGPHMATRHGDAVFLERRAIGLEKDMEPRQAPPEAR